MPMTSPVPRLLPLLLLLLPPAILLDGVMLEVDRLSRELERLVGGRVLELSLLNEGEVVVEEVAGRGLVDTSDAH
jgi:hypothetical protein